MESWLKALIAVACLVIIGGGAYFGWTEYVRKSDAEAAAQSYADASRAKQLMTGNTCFDAVNDIVAMHKRSPITDASQAPKNMGRDVRLCIQYGYLGDFSKNELEINGLYSVFSRT